MKIRIVVEACIGFLLAVAPLRATTFRTVALSADLIPGTSTGQKFNSFSVPILNDSGQVAFFSNGGVVLSQPNSYHLGNKAWSEASGTLSLVAGVGDLLPNAPSGQTVSFFNQFGFNNAGKTALRIGFQPVNGNTPFATYLETSAGLEYISKTGDPTPGVPGATFGALDSFILNNAAQIAFRCAVVTSTLMSSDSIWRAEIGQLNLVARGGTTPGTVLSSDFGEPVFNDNGDVAFRVLATAIWAGQPGSLQLIAQRNGPTPGTQVGETFNTLLDPAINNAGHVAFYSKLNGGGAGIWSDRAGALSLIIRNGDPAPDTTATMALTGLAAPILNDQDHIAFWSNLVIGDDVTASNDVGIWSDVAGAMKLVAREGDPAVGLPSLTFGQFDPNSYTLNALDQVAFLGPVTGPDVTSANDVGIWATDQNGVLRLIAREGDSLEVSPGNFRTISELLFFTGTGNADSRRSGFNDLGQLAFWARFTDQSEGIFVSYLVAESIPGDFNHDGNVDSADYVVWRKNDGTQLGFNTWRANFGIASDHVGNTAAFVPEPPVIATFALCVGALFPRARRRLSGCH